MPCIVFGDELMKLGAPRCRLLICGEKTGPTPTMSGFQIDVQHDLRSLAEGWSLRRIAMAVRPNISKSHCRGPAAKISLVQRSIGRSNI